MMNELVYHISIENSKKGQSSKNEGIKNLNYSLPLMFDKILKSPPGELKTTGNHKF